MTLFYWPCFTWKFFMIWFHECPGQNLSNSSYHFWNDKSFPLPIFHHSSLQLHITPLSILISYIFYFGQKDPIKFSILTLSSALVQICQIPDVIFQTTKLVFVQLLHRSSVSCKITPMYFFRPNLIYFAEKEPIKLYILKTFECPNQNSPNFVIFETTKKELMKVNIRWSFKWEIKSLKFCILMAVSFAQMI